MANTLTLQNSVNFASIYTRLNPLVGVGGVVGEPAITIGNIVRGMILGPPFAWRWNRASTAFLATIGVQDYTLTAWQALTGIAANRIFLDANGNQQATTVGGITGGTIPTWNTALNGTTTDGSVTWVNQGSISNLSSVTSFTSLGWLEKAVAIDKSGNAHELTIQLNSAQNGTQNQPFILSPIVEDPANGRVTFRIQPPPDQNYTIYLIYQQASPTFVALTDTWSPIPDYFSYLYTQGFLSKTYEYLSDERYGSATQMFVKFLVAANEGLTESQVNIFLAERMNSARQQQDTIGTAQSARAGRSLG